MEESKFVINNVKIIISSIFSFQSREKNEIFVSTLLVDFVKVYYFGFVH